MNLPYQLLKTRLLCAALLATFVLSAQAQYQTPQRFTHTLKSRYVEQEFVIHVQVPLRPTGGDERFPVLYETDATAGLMLPGIASIMQLAGERGYWGDSLGGLFGLYVLFNYPELFNRYIIGSPSTWWDDELVVKQAVAFAESGRPLNARAYIAAGSLEEIDPKLQPKRMVTNVFRLDEILAGVAGLNLKVRIFPDESHSSVPPLNYTHGVRHVFGKPDQSVIRQ